jgi:hypothetical protein
MTLAPGASGALKETWADGRDYLTGYARTGTPGDPATLTWTILVRQPEALALSGARALEPDPAAGRHPRRRDGAGRRGAARRLTRPLNALSRAIEARLAAPPDAATLPDVRQNDSYHEVQVLSRALNDMLRTEQQHLDALRG